MCHPLLPPARLMRFGVDFMGTLACGTSERCENLCTFFKATPFHGCGDMRPYKFCFLMCGNVDYITTFVSLLSKCAFLMLRGNRQTIRIENFATFPFNNQVRDHLRHVDFLMFNNADGLDGKECQQKLKDLMDYIQEQDLTTRVILVRQGPAPRFFLVPGLTHRVGITESDPEPSQPTFFTRICAKCGPDLLYRTMVMKINLAPTDHMMSRENYGPSIAFRPSI